MRKILPISLLFICINLLGQNSFKDKLQIISKATIIATDNTPFLLRANQYGVVPLEANLLYLNTGVKKDYDSVSKKFDYGFAVEPHINLAKNSEFLLPEAYVKGKWKFLELYLGRKREIVGLVDTVGTMGSFIWSGNALPIPKIDIGIREFTPIVKGGLLAIKGNYAHGWFGKADSVNNVLLHQKSLYVRVGKPEWRIKTIFGFNHQAQWGGKPTVPYYDRLSGETFTKYGTSLKDYWRVITGRSVSAETGIDMGQNPDLPSNEAGNRSGNHLGSVDIGLQVDFSNKSRLLIYRQSFYEDGSLFYLNNISDGLLGISFSKPDGFNICFEYLNTSNQGGSIYYANIPELRGGDNYFNNGIYRDSWTYKGKTIGTALLNPYSENVNAYSIFKPNLNRIYNNKVKAFNAKVRYTALGFRNDSQILFSKNNRFNNPLGSFSQTSFLHSLEVPLSKFILKGNIGFDIGDYYKNSFGLNLALIKSW